MSVTFVWPKIFDQSGYELSENHKLKHISVSQFSNLVESLSHEVQRQWDSPTISHLAPGAVDEAIANENHDGARFLTWFRHPGENSFLLSQHPVIDDHDTESAVFSVSPKPESPVKAIAVYFHPTRECVFYSFAFEDMVANIINQLVNPAFELALLFPNYDEWLKNR